jgi:RAB protein geranylgeranyltransferase component A|tara:strand:- start:277 stop:519 length:243 start_codon:yes stop_codon:yes gene_type:complete
MSVLSIRIKDNKRKLLKVISALEETTISNLVESWIDDYLEKNRKKYSDELSDSSLIHMMKISEPSFEEWDNPEDDVYNDL